MQNYGVNELRKMFLDFFESKGHLIMKSFSLVPQNDKSLLLINAGMTPLKPYFTGAEILQPVRGPVGFFVSGEIREHPERAGGLARAVGPDRVHCLNQKEILQK